MRGGCLLEYAGERQHLRISSWTLEWLCRRTYSLEDCRPISVTVELCWLLRWISCCRCFSFSSSAVRALQLITRQREIGPMQRSERFR